MKRIYLFDIDGTLLSTGGSGFKSMNAAFKVLLGVSNAQGGMDYSGRIDYDIFCEVTQRHRGTLPTDDEINLLKTTYLRTLGEELIAGNHFRVMPGVCDWLALLRDDSDAVVGLATGNLEQGAYMKLHRAGLRKYFLFGAFGDQDRDRTVIIRKAMMMGQKYAVNDGSVTFVIGDAKNDIVSGKNAGAVTVAVATGKLDCESLKEYSPDLIFKDFSDYRAADRILKDHALCG